MTRKAIVTECIVLAGTAFLAFLLFWLSLYLAGAVVIIPAAIILLVFLVALRRKMRTLQSLAEYGVLSWLLAAQAGILVAILISVLPNLGPHLGGIV